MYLAGGDERLHGHATVRVLGEQRVQDRVADLVGDLVRVPLGDGFGREQASGHNNSGFLMCKGVLGSQMDDKRETASHTAAAR